MGDQFEEGLSDLLESCGGCWVVTGYICNYSDSEWWIVGVTASEASAREIAEACESWWRRAKACHEDEDLDMWAADIQAHEAVVGPCPDRRWAKPGKLCFFNEDTKPAWGIEKAMMAVIPTILLPQSEAGSPDSACLCGLFVQFSTEHGSWAWEARDCLGKVLDGDVGFDSKEDAERHLRGWSLRAWPMTTTRALISAAELGKHIGLSGRHVRR